jgi:catechol 2,3-dioxygenase-like lactoylglutathione lyase family enzyme
MEQKLTLVTLGVRDFERAVAFYREGLGWTPWPGSGGDFMLFPLRGGLGLALYPRQLLADDGGLEDARGWGGVTLAQNVASRGEVDSVLERAVAAGGTLLNPARDKEWGGYSGYFADPDGHAWEIAWNPHFKLKDGLLDFGRTEP